MIYVARVKGTTEAVAVLSARTIRDVFWAIDRVTDPFACEYAKCSDLFIGFGENCGVIATDDEGNDCELNNAALDTRGISGTWLTFKGYPK